MVTSVSSLIWSGGWGIYSLPGGGVEEGEDLLTALRREVLEETGCVCTEITELGIVRENRACQDYTQDNYYFAVSGKRCGEQHLTVDEARNGVKAEWYDLDEVIRRIENQNPERINCKYFRRRDMEALEAYLG